MVFLLNLNTSRAVNLAFTLDSADRRVPAFGKVICKGIQMDYRVFVMEMPQTPRILEEGGGKPLLDRWCRGRGVWELNAFGRGTSFAPGQDPLKTLWVPPLGLSEPPAWMQVLPVSKGKLIFIVGFHIPTQENGGH